MFRCKYMISMIIYFKINVIVIYRLRLVFVWRTLTLSLQREWR